MAHIKIRRDYEVVVEKVLQKQRRFCVIIVMMILATFILVRPTLGEELQEGLSNQAESKGKATRQALKMLVTGIALYPDPIVLLILDASGHPLALRQVAQESAGEGHRQGPLWQRLKSRWPKSVQELTGHPEVLKVLNDQVGLTAILGFAHKRQPEEVWNVIETVRSEVEQKASTAGPEAGKEQVGDENTSANSEASYVNAATDLLNTWITTESIQELAALLDSNTAAEAAAEQGLSAEAPQEDQDDAQQEPQPTTVVQVYVNEGTPTQETPTQETSTSASEEPTAMASTEPAPATSTPITSTPATSSTQTPTTTTTTTSTQAPATTTQTTTTTPAGVTQTYTTSTTTTGPAGLTTVGADGAATVTQTGNTTTATGAGSVTATGALGNSATASGSGSAYATTQGNTTHMGASGSGTLTTSTGGSYSGSGHSSAQVTQTQNGANWSSNNSATVCNNNTGATGNITQQGSGNATLNADGSTTVNRTSSGAATGPANDAAWQHSGSSTYAGDGSGSYQGSTTVTSSKGDLTTQTSASNGQVSSTVTTDQGTKTYTAGDGQIQNNPSAAAASSSQQASSRSTSSSAGKYKNYSPQQMSIGNQTMQKSWSSLNKNMNTPHPGNASRSQPSSSKPSRSSPSRSSSSGGSRSRSGGRR